jgi:hypothetical protein
MAEDSATIDCSPSYTMLRPSQSDAFLSSNITQLQLLFAEAGLAQKWIVIVPDYEGPDASYTASKLTAHAILDGIRAAIRSGDITGIDANPRVGLWGYSGGASATQIAVTMQELYAPELEIAGAAMGGLSGLGDASAIFNLNKGPSSALIPSAMIGLASQYTELQKLIDQSLKPEYANYFYSPLKMCLQECTAVLGYRDILGMFNSESVPGLVAALVKTFKEETEHPPTTIQAPLYIYQSLIDHLSNIEHIDELVQDYCAQGISVQYERANSTNLSHVKYGIVAIAKAVMWMQDRLNGVEARCGCVNHTDTSSTLDPTVAALYPMDISNILISMINAPNF